MLPVYPFYWVEFPVRDGSVEYEIYSLHPCVSSLGAIPIFMLKNTKEFLAAISAVDHRIKLRTAT